MSQFTKNERNEWPFDSRTTNNGLLKALGLVNLVIDDFKPYSLGIYGTFCRYHDPYAEWYLVENERDVYNFLKWIFEDNSIPRKYISSTNLILYGDLIVLNKDRPDLFQRVVKGIHILNAQTKYQRYSAQLIDYLESGLYVDDHESTGLHINLKAIADILLHNDENAYRYLVTANNFNYVAPKHWPI